MPGIIDKNRRAYERRMAKEYNTHTNKFPRIRLFSTGLQAGLVCMNEVGFANEKHMQKFVEDNIETLFPGLTFLKTEFREMTDGERRPDTIAFDTNENTFVVIEYKNRQDGRVVSQAKAYLQDMRDHKGDLVLLAHDNGMQRDKHSFRWKDMYAIIMAPEFEQFQILGARNDSEVELHEIRMHDDLVATVERVGGDHISKGVKEVTGDESKHVDARTGNPLLLPKLYEAIRKRLLDEFPGMEINEKPQTYDGFSLPGSKKPYFCVTILRKRRILLFLARHVKLKQNAPGFVTSANGLDILNEDDFNRVLILLKRQHTDWPRYRRGESLTYDSAV